MGVVRTISVGDRACLVEVGDAVAAASLAAWARASGVPADDIVPAASTVLFDGCDPGDVEAALPRWTGESPGDSRATVRIAVTYDGPDLDRVADLAVPRLDSPRSRVEPGSVALADRWCGIYPTASPGGWLVIGRTDATLWDARREPPALLAPGTSVRFEVA